MRSLSTAQPDFAACWAKIQERPNQPKALSQTVLAILEAVRQRGDKALLELAAKHDDTRAKRIGELVYSRKDFAAAAARIPATVVEALQEATANITAYHSRQQLPTSDINGPLRQAVYPLERVGIYVPGGRACYPSSLLMAGIPAQLAGVRELVVFSPAVNGHPPDIILACAHMNPAITNLYCLGGAQAIAAMAYGTESIAPVAKIVGPGNSYVTEAKRLVYGKVGIDLLAGPSEVAIVADEKAPPEWVAADLCAQAEHDPYAGVFLFSPYQNLLRQVAISLKELMANQPHRKTIEQSLANRGLAIQTRDMKEALDLVNQLAAEHTQLMTENSEEQSKSLTRPPAIFCGYHSPVVFGDYCVGSNHILPTSPAGAFSSALGIYDFVKRVSLVRLNKQQAARLAVTAQTLAESEGLFAHSLSAKLRA